MALASSQILTPKDENLNFNILQISDMDRSNDMLLADNPVQVLLTPPPNLKVEKIVVPNPSFSGKDVSDPLFQVIILNIFHKLL